MRVGLVQYLRKKLTEAPGRVDVDLLDKMIARAERLPEYGAFLQEWLETGSSLALRQAATPFGDYWDSPRFTASVDILDQAIQEVLPAEMDGATEG